MYFAQQTENIDYTEFIQHLISLYFDHKYDDISEVLKIEHNPDYKKNNKPVYKYCDHGMIFLENNNPITLQRIYVDKETKYILNTLLMVTSNSVNEKSFLDLIINKWIKNIHLTGLLENNIITPKIIGKETYVQLKVGKKCWEDLSKACKNKSILMKIGFKMSLLSYLNEISSNIN